MPPLLRPWLLPDPGEALSVPRSPLLAPSHPTKDPVASQGRLHPQSPELCADSGPVCPHRSALSVLGALGSPVTADSGQHLCITSPQAPRGLCASLSRVHTSAPRGGHICLDGGLSSCPADPASPKSLHRAPCPACPPPGSPHHPPGPHPPLMSVHFGAWTLHCLVCRPRPCPASFLHPSPSRSLLA